MSEDSACPPLPCRPASARPDQGICVDRGQKLLADSYQTTRPSRSLLLQSFLTLRCKIKIKLAEDPGACFRSHLHLCPQAQGHTALRSAPAFPKSLLVLPCRGPVLRQSHKQNPARAGAVPGGSLEHVPMLGARWEVIFRGNLMG